MTAERVMELIIKRTKFLIENPHMLELQEKIDKSLKKAGKNQLNKCVIIQTMMIDSVKDLREGCEELIKHLGELDDRTKQYQDSINRKSR